jgi:hypothetical protein
LSSKIGGTLRLCYQVQWFGYPEDESWYPASRIRRYPLPLGEFHKQFPAARGPPQHYKYWETCWRNGTVPEERPDDNQPMSEEDKAAAARQ